MYSNNKGSILIFTLIIFSVISMVTMMCIGLNYSNKTVFNLEYKESKLIENAFSGIEVASSNILKEVNENIVNSKDEIAFRDYFLGNDFINNICNMSEIDLDGVKITVSEKPKFDENGYCNFKIISSSQENSYSKKFQVSIKIKNPFWEAESDIDKESINSNELVIIYDYKEI